MRLLFQIITVIIYVVLPYTVGGYPPSESYSSVYIEIRLGNLSRRFVLMLTTELFIAIISLCITCFALGYIILCRPQLCLFSPKIPPASTGLDLIFYNCHLDCQLDEQKREVTSSRDHFPFIYIIALM